MAGDIKNIWDSIFEEQEKLKKIDSEIKNEEIKIELINKQINEMNKIRQHICFKLGNLYNDIEYLSEQEHLECLEINNKIKYGIINKINFKSDIGYVRELESTRQYIFIITKVTSKYFSLEDRLQLKVGQHIGFELDDEEKVEHFIPNN